RRVRSRPESSPGLPRLDGTVDGSANCVAAPGRAQPVHLRDGRCSCLQNCGVARRSDRPPMRDVFHDELDEIGSGVIEMTRLVAVAMEQATGALLDSDLIRAERVIEADSKVDALRVDLEDRTFQMIARQQPVATDLRVLISTLHLVADLERMGDLALH